MFVYIVGAGPGDPELLTLKAHRLLQEEAEVVVYDRLIPESILEIIPDGVEKIYAGKSCRKHHMTQEEINDCLVDEAKKGKKVVRLKGGDPFIFGRGGEEMLALAEADIPYEIVPGISAASAISASLDIPLTHRGLASNVQYITGHCQKGKEMHLDWQSLANPDTTLVIYMGLAHLPEITEQLIKHGLDPEIPAIAVQNGTTPEERRCLGTVQSIAGLLEKEEFKPPTLVIVGRVVGLSMVDR